MSLEAAIERMTEALTKNTEAVLASNEGREKALASIGTMAPPASAAEAPKTRKPRGPNKAKEISSEDIHAKFAEYMNTDDADERNRRREWLVSLLNEMGADAVTDKPDKNLKGIAPEDRQRALDFLAAKMRGEEVNFSADEPAAEETSLL
jgi:hypothetical protein